MVFTNLKISCSYIKFKGSVGNTKLRGGLLMLNKIPWPQQQPQDTYTTLCGVWYENNIVILALVLLTVGLYSTSYSKSKNFLKYYFFRETYFTKYFVRLVSRKISFFFVSDSTTKWCSWLELAAWRLEVHTLLSLGFSPSPRVPLSPGLSRNNLQKWLNCCNNIVDEVESFVDL